MIGDKRIKKVLYGGDYNPEQWSEEIWKEDMRLLKLAGIDLVTLNVFSWASLQPNETTYQFSQLDKVMELVGKHNLKICMATSTAAHPAWMAKKYPDILRTEFNGMKRKFGGRHNSCPNSPTYQKYSKRLAEKLAERYKNCDNIVAWHISNEYGGECYCENCEKAFRIWLKEKYHTIEQLNRAWNTAFWGHTFYDWGEIVAPNLLSEHFEENRTMFQGISLDYRRFNSDSMLRCYKSEASAIKKIIPDAKVTTNLMGFYKPIDYQKWANDMDFISWDNYPSNEESYSRIAMNHDLMRGLKGGMPFVLMEQTPSVTNWLSYNALKRPNIMKLWSYQAMAHGADAILFFQMRRSIGACEKYHGAVIDHVGHENTRVFREVAKLGKELQKLGEETLGLSIDAKIAIVIDWDNWWALEYSAGPSCDLHYLDEVFLYYRALSEQNYLVDLVGAEDDFSKYKIVIAPVLYMTKGKIDEKIRAFVKNGGMFLTTFFSGIVEEHDLVITGGYPGKLRDILGIWVEEIDALPNEAENQFIYKNTLYPARLLCDIMHTEGAEVVACYEKDFYKNTPVITKHRFGLGAAFYIGTRSNLIFYKEFLRDCCKECGIEAIFAPQEGVEVTERVGKGKHILFILNHSEEEKTIVLKDNRIELLSGEEIKANISFVIEPKGVKLLKK